MNKTISITYYKLRIPPVILSEAKNLKKIATRPFTSFRVTIQIADDRRQMADDGSSETADPYSVILSEAKNLKKIATRPDLTLGVTV